MASSSSSPPTGNYDVFTSFHGADVRKTFLSHLRKQFENNGITMFNDERIKRGQTIDTSLTDAIKGSRISIVVLSNNYASSSWCLDELLEILKCREEKGQIVMPVFHEVDTSDVRKQTGYFGNVFKETCHRENKRTEEDKRKWSQALSDVAKIAGEDFKNWKNEVEMMEKIAKDVMNTGRIDRPDGRVDFTKLDYSHVDFTKVDYSQVDFAKLDYSHVNYGP